MIAACFDCSKSISSEASACPNCGYPYRFPTIFGIPMDDGRYRRRSTHDATDDRPQPRPRASLPVPVPSRISPAGAFAISFVVFALIALFGWKQGVKVEGQEVFIVYYAMLFFGGLAAVFCFFGAIIKFLSGD